MSKLYFRFCLGLVLYVVLSLTSLSFAEVTVIMHASKTNEWTEKQIRDLYLGLLKMRQVEIFEQAEGQPSRSEFYEKFLNKTETQLKQQRSMLVFSGERIPAILSDDEAVFERVKAQANTIGYVSSAYFAKHSSQTSGDGSPVSLFTLK